MKKNKINVVSRDGYEGRIDYLTARILPYVYPAYNGYFRTEQVLKLLEDHKFPYKGKTVTLHGFPDNGDFYAVFVNEEYKFLAAENEEVVDIGASIGDSPIYFAMNGARKVIALEPYPYSYLFAAKNIAENKLEDKIDLINAGYGYDGELVVDEGKIAGIGSDLIASETGKKVRIFSLKGIMEKFELENPLLKMDCEGCEYNLLKEDDEVLNKFKRIQIEYHYGYEKLVDKLLHAGKSVKFTHPVKTLNNSASSPEMYVGFIFAE